MREKNLTISEKCLNNIVLLTANDDFLDDIKKIRKRYSIPPEGFNSWKDLGQNVDKCSEDIEKLRIKYNLSGAHFGPMCIIIMFGKHKLPNDGTEIVRMPEYTTIKNNLGEEGLYIKIYPETSIKDIQNCWNDIKTMSKFIYGYEYKKQKNRPKLIRDYYINYLNKLEIKHKDIAPMINRIFNENLYYYNIGIILNKLKKSAKKEASWRKINRK